MKLVDPPPTTSPLTPRRRVMIALVLNQTEAALRHLIFRGLKSAGPQDCRAIGEALSLARKGGIGRLKPLLVEALNPLKKPTEILKSREHLDTFLEPLILVRNLRQRLESGDPEATWRYLFPYKKNREKIRRRRELLLPLGSGRGIRFVGQPRTGEIFTMHPTRIFSTHFHPAQWLELGSGLVDEGRLKILNGRVKPQPVVYSNLAKFIIPPSVFLQRALSLFENGPEGFLDHPPSRFFVFRSLSARKGDGGCFFDLGGEVNLFFPGYMDPSKESVITGYFFPHGNAIHLVGGFVFTPKGHHSLPTTPLTPIPTPFSEIEENLTRALYLGLANGGPLLEIHSSFAPLSPHFPTLKPLCDSLVAAGSFPNRLNAMLRLYFLLSRSRYLVTLGRFFRGKGVPLPPVDCFSGEGESN